MQAFLAGGGAAGAILQGAVKFIPVIGAIVSTLFSVFLGGTDLKPIVKAINDLANQTAQGLDQMKRFAWSIGQLALNGVLFIARIVGDILQALVNALKSIAAALKKIYKDVIQPIAGALRNLRKILDDVYRRWLRPIINFIQRIRQVLAIFRAFGFRWASALDARLARIEGKIIGPYLWVVRQLNGYGLWINVILTAGGVFQRGPFLNSLYRYQGQMVNLWWNAQLATVVSSGPAQAPGPSPAPSQAQVKADFSAYAHFGVGPYQVVADQARAAFAAYTLGL